jgi:hypothetical protein
MARGILIAAVEGPAYGAIGGDSLSVWSKRLRTRVKMQMHYEGEQILPGDRAAPKDAESCSSAE